MRKSSKLCVEINHSSDPGPTRPGVLLRLSKFRYRQRDIAIIVFHHLAACV